MNIQRFKQLGAALGCAALFALAPTFAHAGAVIVGFDFENAAVDEFSPAASETGAGITNAVFGGTFPPGPFGSRVLQFTDKTFASSSLGSGGNVYNFMRFTTSSALDLGVLSFEAGHNDPGGTPRPFSVRISPEAVPLPTGAFDTETAGWNEVAAIDVPFGFADSGVQNFNIDLTGLTLGPGTYNIGFGTTFGNIAVGTAALFMDDIVLEAADVVPAPGMLALCALGLAGVTTRRRPIAA